MVRPTNGSLYWNLRLDSFRNDVVIGAKRSKIATMVISSWDAVAANVLLGVSDGSDKSTIGSNILSVNSSITALFDTTDLLLGLPLGLVLDEEYFRFAVYGATGSWDDDVLYSVLLLDQDVHAGLV